MALITGEAVATAGGGNHGLRLFVTIHYMPSLPSLVVAGKENGRQATSTGNRQVAVATADSRLILASVW